jgi:hypothetical protein
LAVAFNGDIDNNPGLDTFGAVLLGVYEELFEGHPGEPADQQVIGTMSMPRLTDARDRHDADLAARAHSPDTSKQATPANT